MIKRLFAAAVIFMYIAPSDALACPMCKYGLMSAVNPRYITNLARGYFWSILLMMGVPFILVSTVIALIVRAQKRKRMTP